MRFEKTLLDGALLILTEPVRDQRGYFARTYCDREFGERGLNQRFVQHSVSCSRKRGTLRGMHFQLSPHAEIKLVRCSKGSIWDVIIDLRAGSPTFAKWQGFKLTDQSFAQLYIPSGFAHGFQALTDDVEVTYLISEFYSPDAASGVRYNDPAFGIEWPLPITEISDRDRNWPDFTIAER